MLLTVLRSPEAKPPPLWALISTSSQKRTLPALGCWESSNCTDTETHRKQRARILGIRGLGSLPSTTRVLVGLYASDLASLNLSFSSVR